MTENTELNDDINLENYEEEETTEDKTSGNGKEKQTRTRKEPSGEPVLENDQLTAVAKRLGGFGMSGQAREAFEEEFASLADLISNILGIEEASKVVSLKTKMRPETRLIGGVLAITFVAGFWRFIINKDVEAGGQIKSTVDRSTSQSSGNTESKPETKKDAKTEKPSKDLGDNFTFGEKKREREESTEETEEETPENPGDDRE